MSMVFGFTETEPFKVIPFAEKATFASSSFFQVAVGLKSEKRSV